jgi:hypothetical protein
MVGLGAIGFIVQFIIKEIDRRTSSGVWFRR